MQFTALFCLFLLGSVLGYLLEGGWCFLRLGRWERHSATLWGPFCVLYGAVAVGGYLLSHLMKKSSAALQFLVCALAGSAIEWLVSGFQLAAFGAISWDYRHHPFNLAGRVSLRMALLWGVLGLVLIRFVCPRLDRLVERFTGKKCRLLCLILGAALALDLAATGLALDRWHTRRLGQPPRDPLEQALDEHYGDQEMTRLFPNWDFLAEKYPEEVR